MLHATNIVLRLSHVCNDSVKLFLVARAVSIGFWRDVGEVLLALNVTAFASLFPCPPSPVGSDGFSQRVEGAAHRRNQSAPEEGDGLFLLQRGVGEQRGGGGGWGERDTGWDRACQ